MNLPPGLFDRLAFGDNKAVAIVTADNVNGDMSIAIGDEVFRLNVNGSKAYHAINRGLGDSWVLDKYADTAIVPVSRLIAILLPQKRGKIIFRLKHGFAVICEETSTTDWQLVELEPGIEDPVDEPVQFDSLAACLNAAAVAIIDWQLEVTGVTISGLSSALGALDSKTAEMIVAAAAAAAARRAS